MRPHIEAIVHSYNEVGGINRIDCKQLPSKRAVAGVCEDLLQLLFPGYHDERPIDWDHIYPQTRERVYSLTAKLQVEVEKSLRFAGELDGEHITPHSLELVCDFLDDLPAVRKLLQTDVQAAYEGDPAAMCFEEIILAYPCIEAIATQRMAHFFYQHGVRLLARMMTEWAHSLTGIDIHPGAQIGSHFFMDHGTGIVIGETCVLGSHVKLYHAVTLGARSMAKDDAGQIIKGKKRHPNVQDHVTIYPNATILGGETTIGHHSTIGANVFLMSSVPPYTLAAYEPTGFRFTNKLQKLESYDPVI